MSKSKSTIRSVASQKSTIVLIQAIYKQMERINAQLSQKEKISDFTEMERKMKKLQRKYQKVSESNFMQS